MNRNPILPGFYLDPSWVRKQRGGFVGAYIGMFASGNGQSKEKYADFETFIYEGFEPERE